MKHTVRRNEELIALSDNGQEHRRLPYRLTPEQELVLASFGALQNRLGRGTRRIGAGVRVPILNPVLDHNGHIDFGCPLPDAASEVVLFDRSGRSVSVLVDAGGKRTFPAHPLAVRFTVVDAAGQVVAQGPIPPPDTAPTRDTASARSGASPEGTGSAKDRGSAKNSGSAKGTASSEASAPASASSPAG